MTMEMTKTAATATPDGGPQETTRGVPVFRPLTDIRETDDGVVLTTEMPGVGPTASTSTWSAGC